jgi:hypothetical protein
MVPPLNGREVPLWLAWNGLDTNAVICQPEGMADETQNYSTGPQWPPVGSPPTDLPFEDELARTNARSQELLGLNTEDATRRATDWGYQVRITREDDTSFILTMDLSARRINLAIEHGLVTQAGAG